MLDESGLATYKRASKSEGLAKGARECSETAVRNARKAKHTSTIRTQHANPMGVVHNQRGSGLIAKRTECGHRSEITRHAEQSIGDQRHAGLGAPE